MYLLLRLYSFLWPNDAQVLHVQMACNLQHRQCQAHDNEITSSADPCFPAPAPWSAALGRPSDFAALIRAFGGALRPFIQAPSKARKNIIITAPLMQPWASLCQAMPWQKRKIYIQTWLSKKRKNESFSNHPCPIKTLRRESPVTCALEEEVFPQLVASGWRRQAEVNVADGQFFPFLDHQAITVIMQALHASCHCQICNIVTRHLVTKRLPYAAEYQHWLLRASNAKEGWPAWLELLFTTWERNCWSENAAHEEDRRRTHL